MTANNTWNPTDYDMRFGFVSQYGEAVLDLLEPLQGADVLDVGCGTGHLSAAIAERGAATVVGLDLSEEMLAVARDAHPDLDLVAGDAQTMTLESLGRTDPFDAVFSNAALHWMPDGAAVARAVRDVLRTGGRFAAELGGAGNVAVVDAALRDGLREVGLGALHQPTKAFPGLAQQASWLESANFRVRLMRWYERPTALGEGVTPADWSRHFRANVWALVPPENTADLAAAIDRRAAAAGLSAGGWFIDYCRLQFLAEAI